MGHAKGQPESSPIATPSSHHHPSSSRKSLLHGQHSLVRQLAGGSRKIWVACFLAVALLFGFGFLDESNRLPWLAATQSQFYLQQAADGTSGWWAAADADDGIGGAQQQQMLLPESAAMAREPERPACVSRTQHLLYLRSSRLFPMSEKLRMRLLEYEEMHRRCTEGRDWDAELQQPQGRSSDCQYLVFIESGGVGNRFLGVVSALVYSVLTDRAILMSRSSNMSQLLCEPFEKSSWLLPLHFPQSRMNRMQVVMEDSSVQDLSNATVVKLKMQHGQKANDRRFYCTATQRKLAAVKWVTLDTNQYMVPRFFVMPYLWPKMRDLFLHGQDPDGGPDPAAGDPTLIFTQLSRYVLLPRNFIWDRILRVYWAYLADAGKRVGLQIRRHHTNFLFDQAAYDRVMRCAVQHGLLPNTTDAVPQLLTAGREEPRPVFSITPTLRRLSERLLRLRAHGRRAARKAMSLVLGMGGGDRGVEKGGGVSPQNAAADSVELGRPVAVLIASLNPEYSEEMKRQYGNSPTVDGSIVRVVQVTSDKSQSYNFAQLVDAFTEIWLLALTDRLATSGWSTFGYIAHGIGGTRPYIVDLKGSRHRPGDPACWRAPSREPCCHFPFLDSVCVDSVTNATEPGMAPDHAAWAKAHLRACVDETKGIQLVAHVPEADQLTRLV